MSTVSPALATDKASRDSHTCSLALFWFSQHPVSNPFLTSHSLHTLAGCHVVRRHFSQLFKQLPSESAVRGKGSNNEMAVPSSVPMLPEVESDLAVGQEVHGGALKQGREKVFGVKTSYKSGGETTRCAASKEVSSCAEASWKINYNYVIEMTVSQCIVRLKSRRMKYVFISLWAFDLLHCWTVVVKMTCP